MRPLVVIPGTFGTEIREDGGSVIWGTLGRFYRGPPIATLDGLRGAAGQVMERIPFLPGLAYDILGALVAALESAGYRRGETLVLYPYDWRARLPELAAVLAARVRALSAATGSAVDLLGLSTGGLLVRAALALDPAVPVERVVTSGTPHNGSLESLACIDRGFRFAPLGRVVGPTEFVACPGSFECLPAPGQPVFLDGERDLYDVETWRELRLGVFRHADEAAVETWTAVVGRRIEAARETWELLGRAARPKVLVCVVGEGLPTQARVAVEHGRAIIPGEGRVGRLPAAALADGDGGVCRESAEAWPGGAPRVVRIAVKRHRDVVRNAPALRAILEALA